MKNITCLQAPTLVLPPAGNQSKRSVILQNQAAEIIYLMFFAPGPNEVFSQSLGYRLAAGATINCVPNSPGGPDGSAAIYALSASGTAILHEQHGDYTRSMP